MKIKTHLAITTMRTVLTIKMVIMGAKYIVQELVRRTP